MEGPKTKLITSSTLPDSLSTILQTHSLSSQFCSLFFLKLSYSTTVPQGQSISIWAHSIYLLFQEFFHLYLKSNFSLLVHWQLASLQLNLPFLTLLPIRKYFQISNDPENEPGWGVFPMGKYDFDQKEINGEHVRDPTWAALKMVGAGLDHCTVVADVMLWALFQECFTTVTLIILSTRRLWPSWDSNSWLFWRKRFQVWIYHHLLL